MVCVGIVRVGVFGRFVDVLVGVPGAGRHGVAAVSVVVVIVVTMSMGVGEGFVAVGVPVILGQV